MMRIYYFIVVMMRTTQKNTTRSIKMAWIATAIIGSAVIGGVSSYLGAEAQADAAQAAAQSSASATVYSIDQQREMYEQTRTDQEPWRLAGERGLERIEATPDFEFTAESFMEMKDPSYEWRVDQGVKAMDASAASRGNMFSGAAAKALTEYGQNMGSQEYQNAYNRAADTYDRNMNTQKGLAGIGQQATNMVGQAGMQSAGAIGRTSMAGAAQQGNYLMAAGQAQANMYSGIAQSANTGISNALTYYL